MFGAARDRGFRLRQAISIPDCVAPSREAKQRLIIIKSPPGATCYIAGSTRESLAIMEQYNTAITIYANLIEAAVEFWTAVTFPSIYLARNL